MLVHDVYWIGKRLSLGLAAQAMQSHSYSPQINTLQQVFPWCASLLA